MATAARPVPVRPGPGQESVWDYPRPPALVANTAHLRVLQGDTVVADTQAGWRILETSQAPAYYFPPDDVRLDLLRSNDQRTVCEFKGVCSYFDLDLPGGPSKKSVAWTYQDPSAGYEAIRDHVCFYAQKMDTCLVDGEKARPPEGRFYGGWITDRVVGPFKGGSGTLAW